ncbi:hypothetical protein INS49_004005 [Diaporthe citri]|uniref:uncharacterized protein n=1 Tax=Diaporthe citri TaxID=83186 RepID=UPI001C81B743|nr:uncharacterized protein INS49_004005 [Diaporthe citri]KAG6354924.1 hypothetical protein INS49_004005 [Diaporthe citri]
MSAISRKNACDLLSHLVVQLSNPPSGYERHKGLYEAGPTPRRQGRDVAAIRNLLFTSMRTEVFEIFSSPNLKPKGETIKSKAGDISKPERGVYLHMIVGRDNTVRQPDHFIVLAVLPPGPTAAGFSPKEQALLLNMLEMWCALLLSTLQPSTMAQWHEYGARAGAGRPWVGLNLGCPLDHGGPVKYVNWRHALSESEDPLATTYVVDVLDGRRTISSISDGSEPRRDEVLPIRQHELYTYHANQYDYSGGGSPSERSQDAVDAQLVKDQARVYWDQIRAEEAQVRADTHRMSERLRVDIQRVDAHYRAQIRRAEREMQEMDEDMRDIGWRMSDTVFGI